MKKFIYPLFISAWLLSGVSVVESSKLDRKEPISSSLVSQTQVTPIIPTQTWSYIGNTGPIHWGELDPTYSACSIGINQSPININFAQVKKLNPIKGGLQIHYKPAPFTIENTGFTIQANPTNSSSYILLGGNKYILKQFHFHTPSEHQFNGQSKEMELHFVHQNKYGKIVVIGLLIKEGSENVTLESIWKVMPKELSTQTLLLEKPINLLALLPQVQTYFYYNGSLTTPPCSEGVQWIVFEKPIELSSSQIQDFRRVFPDNHRPIQPLNGRAIYLIQ